MLLRRGRVWFRHIGVIRIGSVSEIRRLGLGRGAFGMGFCVSLLIRFDGGGFSQVDIGVYGVMKRLFGGIDDGGSFRCWRGFALDSLALADMSLCEWACYDHE